MNIKTLQVEEKTHKRIKEIAVKKDIKMMDLTTKILNRWIQEEERKEYQAEHRTRNQTKNQRNPTDN